MKTLQQLALQIEETLSSIADWEQLGDFIFQFHQLWLKLGQQVQQILVQQKIEEKEAQYQGARTKREKKYYTPLGEIQVKRRVYSTPNGLEIKVDRELGLPSEKWFPQVLELACAWGINSEFPNSHRLFTQWSRIKLAEKTLASTVEKTGIKLQDTEFNSKTAEIEESELSRERIYVGVDGVLTPLNQKQGYKEAKVGVIFWEKDHTKKKGRQGRRGKIRAREYVATLRTREVFRARVKQLYQQIVKEKKPQTIVIGDGAPWIWEMASQQFPDSLEILDFYHLSEYVWQVAKANYPNQETQQKNWAEEQLAFLKQSQWLTVIANSHQLKSQKENLKKARANLERYLRNNSTRIDYKSYLDQGLMIGSGVVESSNRRVVTQRLKQAGMHWSKVGAEGIMALRAAYLSQTNRWSKFWQVTESKVS